MKALLILNEHAGSINSARNAVSGSELRDALAGVGIDALLRPTAPHEITDLLRYVANNGPDTVLVAGGDGTASTAAACLAGTPVTLGVLPLGTLNHFARDLGLPAAWRDAVSALAHARRRAIDVGEVNGRVFINNCSIGSYADAVHQREALRRNQGTGKWWAMTLATARVFRELRRLRLHVTVDGQPHALRTPFVVVANNRYSAHVLANNLRPRLDEGKLWLYTTRARRHLAILWLIWQSLLRNIDSVEGLEQWSAAEATIARQQDRPLPIAVDGEVANLEPPLRFRSRPRALHVLAPAPET